MIGTRAPFSFYFLIVEKNVLEIIIAGYGRSIGETGKRDAGDLVWAEAIPSDQVDRCVKSLRKAGGFASHCTIPVIRRIHRLAVIGTPRYLVPPHTFSAVLE